MAVPAQFDSPACFAALIGDEENGTGDRPAAGTAPTHRQYRYAVLETFCDAGGPSGWRCMPRGSRRTSCGWSRASPAGPMHGVLGCGSTTAGGALGPPGQRQIAAVAGPIGVLSTPAPLDGGDFATHSEFTVSEAAGAVRADLAPVLAAPARRSTRTWPWTGPRPGGPIGWPRAAHGGWQGGCAAR
jgi:hypothetical protein